MQNLNTLNTTGVIELFHVQTNTSFELLPHLSIIRIGKPNEVHSTQIDVSRLPDNHIVSRIHADIHVEENTYYIEDAVSSNGTYLNDTKLEPRKRYRLNLGDKIDLGQGNKVTFIFQHQQNIISPASAKVMTPVTAIQPQIAANRHGVDRTSKIVGMALLVAGIVILAANTHIGIFVRIPGVLLCIAGVVVLFQQRINRNYVVVGWVLIALGIAVLLFTGNVFASVNFLAILGSSALLFAGQQLFTTGRVFNYSLGNIKGLLKK